MQRVMPCRTCGRMILLVPREGKKDAKLDLASEATRYVIVDGVARQVKVYQSHWGHCFGPKQGA